MLQHLDPQGCVVTVLVPGLAVKIILELLALKITIPDPPEPPALPLVADPDPPPPPPVLAVPEVPATDGLLLHYHLHLLLQKLPLVK
jgi:hypothetical protein